MHMLILLYITVPNCVCYQYIKAEGLETFFLAMQDSWLEMAERVMSFTFR